jgi:hypothetical protein
MTGIGAVWCANCRDEFTPIEGTGNVDEPNFCTPECEGAFWEREDSTVDYYLGRYSGAPVFE